MRLIDADALLEQFANLEAQALDHLEELNRTPFEDMDKDEYVQWRVWSAVHQERGAYKHDVMDAPTVDAVEVVRCKDCKYHDDEEPGMVWCPNEGVFLAEDWFCADGERREDEG